MLRLCGMRKRSETLKLNLHQLPVVRTAMLETKDLSKPERSCIKSCSPLSLRSRYSAAWSRVAILIADIWRWEEPRSRVCARPLLTGKACSVAGRAATKLPPAAASWHQLLLLARPGHQLPPATEERAQQFGAGCPNLTIICPQSQMWDFT